MIPIKTDQPGLIQYQAEAGDGLTLATSFGVPFYIYDVTNLSVYLTPKGTLADDVANLLVYDVDYYGGSYANPENDIFGFVQLTNSSFPAGANADDIVTIFYEFGAATIIPQYPACSTADRAIDGTLPALPPGCVWMKNLAGTQIKATPLSSTSSVILPTTGDSTSGSVARYNNASGGTQSSNIILTPTTVEGVTYDNIGGINNLSAKGLMDVGSLDVLYGSSFTTVTSRAYIALYDQNNDNQTFILSPPSFAANISYYLPPIQASVAGSFLANDASGKLSWKAQSSITSVGAVTVGTWNAGDVNIVGNITTTAGAITAPTGTFNSLVLDDSSGHTTIMKAPVENFTDNYTYELPGTIGSTNDVLTLQTAMGNIGRLGWQAPRSNKYNLISAWVRFHAVNIVSPPFVSIVISDSYGLEPAPVRIAVGVYQIIFSAPFTGATSYTWQATGFVASTTNVAYVLMLHSSMPNGSDPTATSCTFGLYNTAGVLVDPIISTGLPADVCISFCGY